jgi:hypothetical protein
MLEYVNNNNMFYMIYLNKGKSGIKILKLIPFHPIPKQWSGNITL